MHPESTLLRLIGGIYEAAVEPARWTSVLEQLAEALDGTLTSIFIHDPATNEGVLPWVVRGDPAYTRLYHEHYHAKNVYVTSHPEAIAVGRVLTGEQLCSERDVLRSEIHADWMSPQDIFWTTGAAVLQEDSALAIVTSMRPHRAAPFGSDEVALQQALVPHFQRALQLQRRLRNLVDLRRATSGALDRLSFGAMLLDQQGRPFLINACAQRILGLHDGLSVGADGLQAAAPADTVLLARAVAAACAATRGRGRGSGGALRVSRPSGRRPLSILVTPLPRERMAVDLATACAAVFVTDPENAPPATGLTLARLYGLTPAEARLLGCLTRGASIAQAAEELALSPHTVRAQLKAIFTKTGTCRQSELLRMVLAGPATMA